MSVLKRGGVLKMNFDKNEEILDLLTEHGYILRNNQQMKKALKKVKKKEPWIYHFYINKEVDMEQKKRYKGNDKKVINRIKSLIIEEKYGLEMPNYIRVILISRDELNG